MLCGVKLIAAIIHKPAPLFHSSGSNVAVLPKDSRGRHDLPGRTSPFCQFSRAGAAGGGKACDCRLRPCRWRGQRLRSAVPGGGGAAGFSSNPLQSLR
ncbi:hypothetical protein [Azospirillum largimobile]